MGHDTVTEWGQVMLALDFWVRSKLQHRAVMWIVPNWLGERARAINLSLGLGLPKGNYGQIRD